MEGRRLASRGGPTLTKSLSREEPVVAAGSSALARDSDLRSVTRERLLPTHCGLRASFGICRKGGCRPPDTMKRKKKGS